MVQSQYSLAWESFKSNFTKGFSTFQQNGEFVDMTLAADGCYVKVHQVVMALASPYIKELITSAPCQHPVFFLNNISSKTLSLLLEYIYTGEVLVSADNLRSFTEAAKSLHIKGLENLTGSEKVPLLKLTGTPLLQDEGLCHIAHVKTLPMGDRTVHTEPLATAQKVPVKLESTLPSSKPLQYQLQVPNVNDTMNSVMEDPPDFSMDTGIRDYSDDDDCFNTDSEQNRNNITLDTTNSSTPPTRLQYSVSIRGSQQLILNRYIYNMHSLAARTGVRRWRCIDYRNNKCKAYVVTKGNIVLNRAHLHNHAYHDKKILSKIEKKCVFSVLEDVQLYKEKEAEENACDSDFISVDN
ncbi:hypothetical protein ACJJTC_006737 [Scirpophaga incertulas]